MADKKPKLDANNVAAICEKIFSLPVKKITAPGGKSRESLRVHFDVKTIIATQRSKSGRMRMEVEVLKRLTKAGAPVPKYLGGSEALFFQEDVGATRLSGEITRLEGQAQLDLAARTIASLLEIRSAGNAAGLPEVVPALGEARDWVGGFVGTAAILSKKYGFAAPKIDASAVIDSLMVTPDCFIKWDARPGNGAVGKDGRVYWFDWEHCGKRQGMEDFAWLAGDEFWPIGPEDMARMLLEQLPRDGAEAEVDYLSRYISFHIVQRLRLIFRRFIKGGWVNPEAAMRYDKIGTDKALALRLCRHGAGWALRSELTRPMVAWFDDCASAISALETADIKSA